MNVKRLEHLIETLKDVAKRDKKQDHSHFDMETWKSDGSPTEVDCGTTACALGWEATTKYARSRGLKLIVDDWATFPEYTNRSGNVSAGMEAGAAYFGISLEMSEALFDPDAYSIDAQDITPQDVIKRVKYFLKGGQIDTRNTFSRYEAYHELPGNGDDDK